MFPVKTLYIPLVQILTRGKQNTKFLVMTKIVFSWPVGDFTVIKVSQSKWNETQEEKIHHLITSCLPTYMTIYFLLQSVAPTLQWFFLWVFHFFCCYWWKTSSTAFRRISSSLFMPSRTSALNRAFWCFLCILWAQNQSRETFQYLVAIGRCKWSRLGFRCIQVLATHYLHLAFKKV